MACSGLETRILFGKLRQSCNSSHLRQNEKVGDRLSIKLIKNNKTVNSTNYIIYWQYY